MAPLDWSWGESYGSAATITMPQAPYELSNTVNHMNNASFIEPSAPSGPPISGDQWQMYDVRSMKTGRKRSRDDMGWDEDESSRSTTAPFPSARHTPSPPKHEMGLDSGMDLSFPGAQMDQEGEKDGFLAEELSERLRSSGLTREEQQARPGLEARKSIRLDRDGAGLGDAADKSAMNGVASQSVFEESKIDQASMILGVGWSSLRLNSTMDQASRGWARYIETHFPVQSVKILWKNDGLEAYLVEAVTCDGREQRVSSRSPTARASSPWVRRVGSPGYFLFDQKMTQGKLVAKSWERTLQNLRVSPIVFEGDRVMEANEDEAQNHSEMNNLQHWAGWKAAPSITALPVPALPPVQVDGDGMDME